VESLSVHAKIGISPLQVRLLFLELSGTESGASQAVDPEAQQWLKFRVDLTSGLESSEEAFAKGLSACKAGSGRAVLC
jgi:hypothetical protein